MSTYHMEPMSVGSNPISEFMAEVHRWGDHHVGPRCLSRVGLSAERVRQLTADYRTDGLAPDGRKYIMPASTDDHERAIRANIRRFRRIRSKDLVTATKIHPYRIAKLVKNLQAAGWPVRKEYEPVSGGKPYLIYVWEDDS